MQRHGCEVIGGIRSGYGGNRVRLTFANNTSALRHMAWIDQRGEVRWDWSEYSAEPGSTENIGSRRNHVLGVYDENRECLEVVRAGLHDYTVTLE